MDQGQYEQARHYYQQSLTISQQQDNLMMACFTQNNLGLIAMYQGDYAQGQHAYEASARVVRAADEMFDAVLGIMR